jgi:endo-1,4-beta-mannosidase
MAVARLVIDELAQRLRELRSIRVGALEETKERIGAAVETSGVGVSLDHGDELAHDTNAGVWRRNRGVTTRHTNGDVDVSLCMKS